MGTEPRARRHAGVRGRFASLVTASLVTFGAAVAFLTVPTPATADPIEQCTATNGAVVAVDFGPFGGKVVRGCDTTPTTGYELLHTGGFTTEGTVHDGDGFICRIGNASVDSGRQYPTPAKESCVLTPKATAYWSYWIASPGQSKWTYSPLGAMARTLKPGDVDAWVYGATDKAGTTGKPAFTPDDVRAPGGSSPSPDPTGPPTVPPGAVDVPAATRWLTGQLQDGERVVDEGATTPNYLLTTEVVYALAGVDRESPAARKAADFLGTPDRTDAYAYPAGKDAIPDATAAARLALVAEATGKDPRDFGGHDLLGDLVTYVCPRDIGDGDTIDGCLTKGDFRTTGQSDAQALAVIALYNGGMRPPADAVDRLTGLQCDDGGFTSILIRSGGWCDSDAASTGLITLALLRSGTHGEAVEKARAYLKKTQLPNGAWPSASYLTTGSANSTGWAAQALRALGDAGHADAGVAWLSRQQLPQGGFGFDEDDTDSRVFATAPAVIAGAKSDLVALTGKETVPPTTPPTTPPTSPPTTPPSTPPTGDGPDLDKGTAYLVDHKRLVQGRSYESSPGFADFGMTIDGAYALAATGKDNATLRDIVDFLDKGGTDGKGRDLDDWTLIDTKYAGGGSIGKAALLAEAVGRDPRDFGGHDLIAALAKGTCAARGTAKGLCAGKGNYANATSVFSQSLGVIAQIRAGETGAAAQPIAFLKSLQDRSGGWVSLIGEPSDTEVDSTAMAAMALDLLPDAGSKAAVDKALAWLAGRQEKDGGFPGASGNSVNSAALAVQGLSLDSAKYAGPLAKAREFLASQQNRDGGFNIAEDVQPGTSDVRASTQAVGGATGISFGVLARSLDGTNPRPLPSNTPQPSGAASPPVIVTTGDDTGAVTDTGNGGPGGGALASTGAEAGALAAAAVALVAGGWVVTRAARRRRRTTGGDA
ncbi:prenyltransferase/squalene oxidase repeat-containing protein [Streptomyces seoulensis]